VKLKNKRLKGPAEVLFVLGACASLGILAWLVLRFLGIL